eukprot:2111580-Rhodomonas_salina.1
MSFQCKSLTLERDALQAWRYRTLTVLTQVRIHPRSARFLYLPGHVVPGMWLLLFDVSICYGMPTADLPSHTA